MIKINVPDKKAFRVAQTFFKQGLVLPIDEMEFYPEHPLSMGVKIAQLTCESHEPQTVVLVVLKEEWSGPMPSGHFPPQVLITTDTPVRLWLSTRPD